MIFKIHRARGTKRSNHTGGREGSAKQEYSYTKQLLQLRDKNCQNWVKREALCALFIERLYTAADICNYQSCERAGIISNLQNPFNLQDPSQFRHHCTLTVLPTTPHRLQTETMESGQHPPKHPSDPLGNLTTKTRAC